jgi:hypothetical protein
MTGHDLLAALAAHTQAMERNTQALQANTEAAGLLAVAMLDGEPDDPEEAPRLYLDGTPIED